MTYKYQNFYEMLKQSVVNVPNSVLFFDGDKKIKYKEFLSNVDNLASQLIAKGIHPKDKVAMFVANGTEFIELFFAITRIGAISVPINTFLKHDEVAYILNDSDSKILFASKSLEKEAKNLESDTIMKETIWIDNEVEIDTEVDTNLLDDNLLPSLEDLATIIYTSGTTGNPKGAMLSFKNLFSNLEAANDVIKLTKKDRFIVYLPMFHAFTLTATVLLPVFYQSSIVVIRNLQPFSNIIKQVLLKRVTIFMGVPDVYNALSKAKLPWYFKWFNAVRVFISGAAALSADTVERFTKAFPRATLVEGYGLSECSPAVTINRLEKQKVGSVGPALADYKIKIVDEELMELPTSETGEILVQGDNVMLGYLNRPDATDQTIINGWLRTGDLGYVDEDGYLFIVDRIKDLIISKGLNIYPREIEEVLNSIDGINASAVIGVNDEKQGEIPVAYIECDEGATQDESAIKQKLRDSLANYKVPKYIKFVDELPRNATGKVLKRALKQNNV